MNDTAKQEAAKNVACLFARRIARDYKKEQELKRNQDMKKAS